MSTQILRPKHPIATVAGALTALGLAAWTTKSLLIRDVYAESPAPSPPPNVFSGFPGPTLRLESSENVNHNTKRVRFAFPNPESKSGLTLTSSVLTVSWPKGRWFPVLRPYTPISSLDEPGTLELLIKRYPNGKASTYLHSLTPGETLFFLTAIPGYKWTPNAHAHVTMIAGGAGITPIFQLTRGILQNPEDKTAITLIFGINSDADALFKKEFDEFETKYPGRFKAVYTVSNPVEGSKLRKGYVTKTLLEEVLGEEKSEKVFVCGPPKMEEALTGKKGILQELGFAKGQVHKF